jgi:RND family efflux transporter MFP subunit
MTTDRNRIGPRRRGLLGAALAVVLIVAGLLYFTGGEDETARENTPAPVLVQPAETVHARANLVSVGTARALRSVMLHPAASGEVVAVTFDPGDRVEKGAALVELDARRERLAVEAAEVEVRNAEQLLARYERIKNTGAVSESQIDEVRASLDAARIELKQARVALVDRTVRAPFAGYVGVTDVDPGDRIDPATEIAPFDDRSTVLIDFEVPEAYLGRIEEGTTVTAQSWTAGGETETGRVQHLGSRIDPADRTFTVRAAFDNADDTARPGMSYRISLNLEGRSYPFIPEASILWGGEGSYLWAVREGKAARVPAVIVERREGHVLVDADLRDGDLIVVEGVQRLREDGPVEVVNGQWDAAPVDAEMKSPTARTEGDGSAE